MAELIQWIRKTFGMSPELQEKLLASVAVIAVLWLIRQVIVLVVFRRSEDIRLRYRGRKISAYVTAGVAILVVGRIWFEGFKDLSTFLGLVSAGLAIALKDLIVNLAGWAFILWRKPFEVGDRIQIGDHAGDVIDLRIFQFTLMEVGNWVEADQSTGRVIHIPNGRIFQEVQANFSKGFHYIWNEIPITVTFESNWKKAKEILLDIAARHAEGRSAQAAERVREAARRFMIVFSKLTPTVYTSVRENGVRLTVRYLCEPRRRRGSEQAIWEDVLEAFFREPDIDFAYPTQRFYNNVLEGKPETRRVGPEVHAQNRNAD